MNASSLSQEYLKECFDYNPDTGVLIWKKRPRHHFKIDRIFKSWNSRYSGTEVGHKFITEKGKSYLVTSVEKCSSYIHRIIWIMLNNEIPNQIDHINGNGLDNRLVNLRNVTALENCRNTRRQKRNTSGCIGVSWHKASKKWRAHITNDKEVVYLGYSHEIWEVICARKSAEYKYGFHVNHGAVRPL